MDVVELWWLSLAIAAVVVVVVAVLLGLIVAAARGIDRRTDDIWVVGKRIAGNTVSIWMLDETNRQLGAAVDSLQSVERNAMAIDQRLSSGARGRP